MFPRVEPWQEDVNFAELLDELSQEISKYSILPEGANVAIALWIVGTYIFAHLTLYPVLLITSPEKRCGKTTLLMIIEFLVHAPLVVSNISAAALYRIIELHTPTLMLDEGDTFLADKAEMTGIMNGGHTKSTARVLRCVGDSHEPRSFSTWCPKTIAMIKKPADTLIDRSLVIQLRRKLPTERTERIRHADIKQFEPIRRKLVRTANEFGRRISESRPELPGYLHSRAADNWETLIAIADFAGEEWGKRARNAAMTLTLTIDNDEENLSIQLLRDIAGIFDASKSEGLTSKALCERLAKIEESPWNEFGGIDPRKLAKLLAPFDIRPRTHRLAGSPTNPQKGYLLSDFTDAFNRYLGNAVTSVTPLQTNTEAPETESDNQ
jgi:putative DNA primase/helicase